MATLDVLSMKLQSAVESPDQREQATICREVLSEAIDCIYEDCDVDKPKRASMLERISGRTVENYIKDSDVIKSLDMVRILGSHAQHGKKIRKIDAKIAIENTASLLDFIEAKRNGSDESYKHPANMTEYETRQVYIDLYLGEAGWEVLEKKNVQSAGKASIEIEVQGMPNPKGKGYCDYVLYGRDGKPLAIVEAKKTSVDPVKGRHQADLYAECMKKVYGYKPVIYYTNGYTTKIIDGIYPDRDIMAFHTIDELERMIQQRNRGDIKDLKIDNNITNRPYQKIAITNICEWLNKKHRRGLLVMATGTGKTRVAISIVDVLSRNKWIKNVLFLADRTALVNQAKRNFNKLLPNMSICELSGNDKTKDLNARLMFSTYHTMINYIDAEEKLFTSGRFDLIVIDEAHRSIFNKFRAIFDYFDSLLIGLTATPKDEVDLNTYRVFGCEAGIPNYDYPLADAVRDHYLVPYEVINKTTQILKEGIKYDDLTDDEKAQLDEYLEGEDPTGLGFVIPKTEVFKKLYNKATCNEVLEDLMNYGKKVDGGQTLGKTVIFAYNHLHADLIVKCFHDMYPEYDANYCQLVDNYVNYADDLVIKFEEDPDFRIAVSVDMLDTGVDVPEILNLVFFKPVKSKIKFVQMIGRGTRLCPDIYGPGLDKRNFRIFDYCGNFEFFDEHPEGKEPTKTYSLSQRLFDQKVDMLRELQKIEHQQDTFKKSLYDKVKTDLKKEVKKIKNSSQRMDVRKEMAYVDKYCKPETWDSISAVMFREINNHLTPLINGGLYDDFKVISFDIRMMNIEQSILEHGDVLHVASHVKTVRRAAKFLLDEKASIPQVFAKSDELKKLAGDSFWQNVTVKDVEESREAVRELMAFANSESGRWQIDIKDETEFSEVDGSKFSDFDIRSYKEKVIDYIAENLDNTTIEKIRKVEPIDAYDINELERILWEDLGTKEDYASTTKTGNVAVFIRSLVGLDQDAINKRFGAYLGESRFNALQQEFIQSIINYVRENGDIVKEALIEEEPFSNYDIGTLFDGDVTPVVTVVDMLHESVWC